MKHIVTRSMLFVLLFSCLPFNFGMAQTVSAQNTARIGVLAFRGTSAAKLRWLPLVDYLSKSIEGWRFELVSEAGMAPSGVVRLVELQEDGYAYVRP